MVAQSHVGVFDRRIHNLRSLDRKAVWKVAIVGMGPRGLTILERILAYARNDRSFRLEINVFDPGLPGAGVHDPKQPQQLLLNTVACQLTQFPDDYLRGAGPDFAGPSFSEWMSEFASGQQIDPNGYYPRAAFGRYLNWCYEFVRSHAPENVRIIHHPVRADRILPTGGKRWSVVAAAGAFERGVDFVFLTIGHAQKRLTSEEVELRARVESARPRNSKLQVIFDPYPLPDKVRSIGREDTIVIDGAGLTAFDIISILTVARGGRFERKESHCHYIPSGREPNIILLSRSGLTLMARGCNQKGAHGQYKGKFLTVERISRLREQSTTGKLDFYADVLPLLLLDMSRAYYSAYLKGLHGPVRAMEFSNALIAAQGDDERDALVAMQIPDADRFTWERLISPIPAEALQTLQAFQRWQLDLMAQDIADADSGNVDNPTKAACDVLRDLRDTLRFAVDYGGLEERSHRRFLTEFVPVMNRLAVGPPKRRIEELRALIEAGVVRFDFRPGAYWSFDFDQGQFRVKSVCFPVYTAVADAVIRARIPLPGSAEEPPPLTKNLLSLGVARNFMNGSFQPGGLEVDKNLNIVDREGEPLTNFWCLGTPTEGCKFYTFVVPRPGVNSTSLVDAGRAVGRMMELIHDASAPVLRAFA